MDELDKCPVCGSEETVRVHVFGMPDRMICRDCGNDWIPEQQTFPEVDWSLV